MSGTGRISHPRAREAMTGRAVLRAVQLPERAKLPHPVMRERCWNYGAVVASVSVSVFAYCPVRSASAAPMDCLKLTVTASLETGAA